MSGLGCAGCGGRCGGLGATEIVDPTQVRAIGAPVGTDPAVYLRAHLNRYTAAAGAPIGWRNWPTMLPLVAAIDAETASRAMWVISRRAGAASLAFSDAATKDLLKTVGQGWANPIGYITTNLPSVIDVVRLYGDANGLPAAIGVGGPKPPGANGIPREAWIVGGVLVAFLLVRKAGR